MRRLFKLGIVAFMGFFMCSCQDSLMELETPLDKDASITRSNSTDEMTDYYWSEGKKVFISRCLDKSYVLFRGKDEKDLLSSLTKKKIHLYDSQIKDLSYEGTDMSGENAKDFLNYKWAEVNTNVDCIFGIPEVEYAAPFYIGPGGDTYPLTNFIYVYLKNDYLGDLQKLSEEYNVAMIGYFEGISNLYIVSCTKDSKGNALEIANIFYETGNFDGVEPVFMSLKMLSDPWYSSYQWNLASTTTYYGTTGSDIHFESALNLMPSSSSVFVAVVDNGIDLNHPDLLLHSYSWNAATNSSPSVIYSYDSESYTNHGTNAAGVISAKYNNNIGIAGVASKSGIKVMSLSVSFNGSLLHAQAALAIRKATDMGADVINNSWGGGSSNQAVNQAIDYAVKNGRYGRGCVLVFGSGNTGGSLVYPANYSPAEDVIAVGGIMPNGQRMVQYNSIYLPSSYGVGLDVVAPGVLIPTTRDSSYSIPYTNDFNGTSAAAPHVSAIAALILAKSPYLSNRDVEYIINASANKTISGFSGAYNGKYGTWCSQVGYGLLDAYAALTMAGASVSGGSSVSITGPSSVSANGNGYVTTTLTASAGNSNYTYIWSGIFNGECTSWSILPSGTYETGPNALVTINLNPSQAGGSFVATCRVFNGTTYIGAVSHYMNVIP